MSSERTQLLLTISPERGADAQELAELSRQLRAAVLESDADTVEPTRADAAPAGAKGDPLTLATLAITIAPTAVEGLIRIVQAWVSRHERASVTVEAEGAKLTVTGDPSAMQGQLVDAFLAHHKH
jgi:hypothetical protein